MPLPTINNLVTIPNPGGLTPALLNHPIVTNQNAQHLAKEGNLTWVGNRMQISAVGVTNYCYIPAVPDCVSYGVVDCGGAGGGDFYVISDQYGGCEYDELYNAGTNQLAFLHIYRGGGGIAKYTKAQGWVSRSKKRSAHIAQQQGVTGSNWSVSLVDRGNNPPTVLSKFVHIRNMAAPHAFGSPLNPAILTVIAEDNGDTEYSFGDTGYRKQALGKIARLFG
jgi:hypothetical protein